MDNSIKWCMGVYMRETGNLSHFLLAHSQMTFTQQLIADGYVYDDEDGIIHCYQECEDEGEWNYVKMTDEFDVITEKIFIPESK